MFAEQTANLQRPLIVAAHSHAAWIAWEAVATSRARVDVLVLVGVFPETRSAFRLRTSTDGAGCSATCCAGRRPRPTSSSSTSTPIRPRRGNCSAPRAVHRPFSRAAARGRACSEYHLGCRPSTDAARLAAGRRTQWLPGPRRTLVAADIGCLRRRGDPVPGPPGSSTVPDVAGLGCGRDAGVRGTAERELTGTVANQLSDRRHTIVSKRTGRFLGRRSTARS